MEEVPTWVAGGAAEKWAAEKTEAAEKGRKRRKKGKGKARVVFGDLTRVCTGKCQF